MLDDSIKIPLEKNMDGYASAYENAETFSSQLNALALQQSFIEEKLAAAEKERDKCAAAAEGLVADIEDGSPEAKDVQEIMKPYLSRAACAKAGLL